MRYAIKTKTLVQAYPLGADHPMEKKLVELYRKASAEEKKAALKALKGDNSLTEEIFEAILDSVDTDKIVDAMLDSVLGKKK